MVEFWVYVCIFVKMEYVCKELIGEYKAVVQRPKLKKYIGEKDVLDTLELMSLYCFCVDIEKPEYTKFVNAVRPQGGNQEG